MKKFISLVMAGAMVLSLVPATAFAKGSVTATAKVVDALKMTADFKIDANAVGVIPAGDDAPELQIKVSAVDYQETHGSVPTLDVTVSLDNADFTAVLDALDDEDVDDVSDLKAIDKFTEDEIAAGRPGVGTPYADLQADLLDLIHITDDTVVAPAPTVLVNSITDISTDEFTFTITNKLGKDDVVVVDMVTTVDKTNNGKTATVSVESKAVTADDLVFCSILDKGLTASVKKTVDVAEEELTYLDSKGIKIKANVDKFYVGQRFELKLSNGFAFTNKTDNNTQSDIYIVGDPDDNIVIVTLDKDIDEFTIEGADIQIEADTAKSGAVATLTVKALRDAGILKSFSATAAVEVAKVCDYKVSLTVDEDEDIPVIYSGTDIDNTGLTDDSDHLSLEVTAKETFPGAWSMRQGFNFNLPEGVYVADKGNTLTGAIIDDGVIIKKANNFLKNNAPATAVDWQDAFFAAYREGDYKNFEFKKRVFDDVNNALAPKAAELTFQLRLVADPTFEGDVVLTFEGALVDTQSVTIAKFVKPYTVKAEQNDVIIDYRNTEIKTPITITEAEGGLWKKGTIFALAIETGSISFEDDATFEADKDSEMELNNKTTAGGSLSFAVKSESDSAATVTVTDMELFMNRSIPAGGYDLEIDDSTNALDVAYLAQPIYAGKSDAIAAGVITKGTVAGGFTGDNFIADVEDYSRTVKAAFVNVVTSGRDQDNLFTTKVVVPVGEAYLVAGETKVTLDAPAYISAAGYTMLPVRAVSSALGVDTNNVLWSAETKTVTIMFAQRIISMTVGQKTIYVNGSAIPSSAAPEIKDGRTFLPLRDLGTALGVTNVSWDSATKTATLN